MPPHAEPDAVHWREIFLHAVHAQPERKDLLGVGPALAGDVVLGAYAAGVFPMGLGQDGEAPIGWWSPDPRGVLLPGDFHISRSLKRSIRKFQVTVDEAFDEVMAGCADVNRQGRWITPQIARVYSQLHRLGVAHSVEVWSGSCLVGGLYGLSLGHLFAGESMFHRETDASKVAFWAAQSIVFSDGKSGIFDVQWKTPHLESLGVTEVDRTSYLRFVAKAIHEAPIMWQPQVDWA